MKMPITGGGLGRGLNAPEFDRVHLIASRAMASDLKQSAQILLPGL